MTGELPSRPGAAQIARQALAGFTAALTRMPVLVLVSLLAFVLLAVAKRYAEQKLGLVSETFMDGIRSFRVSWFHALRGLVMAILVLPLTLATCRFVLRGETGPQLFSRSGMAFARWFMGIAILSLALLYLTSLVSNAPTLRLLGYLLWAGVILIPFSLLPLFPAFVVEAPAADTSDRLETALAQWDDNLFLFLFTAFPVLLAWYGARWVFVRFAGQEAWDKLGTGWAGDLTAAIVPLAFMLLACVVCSFYAWSAPHAAASRRKA